MIDRFVFGSNIKLEFVSWTTVNLGNKCLQNKKCQLRGKEVHVSRGTQVYKIDLQTITL